MSREISDRVTSKVITGKKDMLNIFNLYAMKGKDLGHDVIGWFKERGGRRGTL